MRITPINTTLRFNGITSMDKKVPGELFGNKEKEFEALSNAKNLNIWAMKSIKGCMANQQMGYMVLIQDDKSGVVMKELECADNQTSKDEMNDKLEQCLVWANAPSNISAAQAISNSEYAKESPKHAEAMKKILYQSATCQESSLWRERIDRIV